MHCAQQTWGRFWEIPGANTKGIPFTATPDATVNLAYKSNGVCINSSTVSSSAPLPGALAATIFSAGEYTSIGTQNAILASHECDFAAPQDAQAQEFSFALNSSAAQTYSQITIKWVGAAGFYIGSCSGFAISGSTETGAFPKLEIYNSTGSVWESIGTPSTTIGTQTGTYASPANYVYSGAVRLRLIGGKLTGANCSRLESDYVEAKIE